MDKKKENEDVSAVLGVLVIVLGGLGFWWWQLGDEGRRGWLSGIGREGGYGRPPADMVGQLEWLLANRVEDLQGMFLLFVLMSAAGAVEGNARRQAVMLAGFGLRRLRNGRVLMLVWACLTAACLVAPVALPYREVSLGLAGLLLLAMYTVGRGLRRVH